MNNSKKMTAVVVSLLLILCLGAGGTLAFLIDTKEPVVNEFQPANVTPTIVETFNGKTKENVKIKNSGNANAYIRVAVVASWQVSDGVLYGKVPQLGEDYTMTPNLEKDGWFYCENDGFYYYSKAVAPGGETGILIQNAAPIADKAPEGCTLHIEIVAQTIQSDWSSSDLAQHPAAQHWGVTVAADGNISKG